ncbi:MAG: type 2 isopentenyl-diphosphate Delta-isomerase [Aigarchaeota archaeon]|nr:type 2 isopentenyl-diphosphate Delta-isomerase [Aigarchaeota archaeon]
METKNSTAERKRDHIRICLERSVQFKRKSTWLEHVHLLHNALPEISAKEIKTETRFLGAQLSFPFMIEAMTGGVPEALEINSALAESAESLKVGMCVGSQRLALEDAESRRTFRVAREKAPTAFLVANIGAAQLSERPGEKAAGAVEMIEANALSIHLNPLQEVVQGEDQAGFSNVLKTMEKAVEAVDVPVIVKETGCGISREVAKKLITTGVSCLDVAGAGGTSWAAVESLRAEESHDDSRAGLGREFWDWGIPTAASVIETRSVTNLPIVASGGLRTGLDLAKCLAIGANLGGAAHPLLWPATMGANNVIREIRQYMTGLRAAMFVVGARSIVDLRRTQFLVTGELMQWLDQRKIKPRGEPSARKRK